MAGARPRRTREGAHRPELLRTQGRDRCQRLRSLPEPLQGDSPGRDGTRRTGENYRRTEASRDRYCPEFATTRGDGRVSWPTAPIGTLAEINPSPPSLDEGEEVAFVPMAAVFETGSMTVSEHRTAATLNNGYTYFQTGDVLVAKITPCFENNKIAQATLDRPHGFGSTEFHVV